MKFRNMIWISMCTLLLTACGDKINTLSSLGETDSSRAAMSQQTDPILDFQKKVIPVVEEAIHGQFPKENRLEYFDYYFDNDNLKVVFLVDKEETSEMKSLHQELTERLGDKVVFKKAKHNPEALRDLTDQVSDYVQKLRLTGGYSVFSRS